MDVVCPQTEKCYSGCCAVSIDKCCSGCCAVSIDKEVLQWMLCCVHGKRSVTVDVVLCP